MSRSLTPLSRAKTLENFYIPPLPCPVALRGCFASQNIGVVAHSDGGVNSTKI